MFMFKRGGIQSSSFPTKGQTGEMGFPKTKKGFYISKKHGKLQFIPWGARFRVVTIKVIHA